MKRFLFYVLVVVCFSSTVLLHLSFLGSTGNDKRPVRVNGSRECFASLRIGAILPGQYMIWLTADV